MLRKCLDFCNGCGITTLRVAQQGDGVIRNGFDVINATGLPSGTVYPALHRLELEQFEGDTAHLFVECSKGTYIRTLGEGIGAALGCGAHLEALLHNTGFARVIVRVIAGGVAILDALFDGTEPSALYRSDVQRAVIDQERKDNNIQNYIKDSALPYVDVKIKNVILDDLRQSPFSARIEFEKVYSNPADHTELKRERWTASVTYVFRENVKNNELAVNPLGLTIVRFRADQAFS